MGKASSSKKVARAARAGGAAKGSRRQWLFPAGIFAIFVVGISIVLFARSSNQAASAAYPAVGDHIHMAFGVFVCDKYLPAVPDSKDQDVDGIHTHGDGIMHIHPFKSSVAGKHAKLQVFADRVGLKLSNDKITMPDGSEYPKGYDCNGTPAEISVYYWANAFDDTAAPTIYTSDFGSVPIQTDRGAIAIVIAPPGTDVPKPDSVPTLNKLDPATDNVVPDSGSTNTSVVELTPTSVLPDSSVPAGSASTSSTAGP